MWGKSKSGGQTSAVERQRQQFARTQQAQQQREVRDFESWVWFVCEQTDHHLEQLSRGRKLIEGFIEGSRYNMRAMVMVNLNGPGVVVSSPREDLAHRLEARYGSDYSVSVERKEFPPEDDEDDDDRIRYVTTIGW